MFVSCSYSTKTKMSLAMWQMLQCTGDGMATPWKSMVCYQLLAEGGRDQKGKKKKMKPRNRKDSDARLINLSANLIFSEISRSSKHWLPVCYFEESNAKRPVQPSDKREGHTDMQSTWAEKHGCTVTPCLHASCTAAGLAGAGWGRDHFVISNR